MHVALVADRHADLADLAAGELVVGVVARLGREVEGDREPGLALGEVAAVELVGRDRPSSARRRSASSRACPARAGGGTWVDSPASGITPRHARDRHVAPRGRPGDLLLGARRRARRPRPGVDARDAARGARRTRRRARSCSRTSTSTTPARPARSCAAGRSCPSTCTSAGRATWRTPRGWWPAPRGSTAGRTGCGGLWGEVVPVPEAQPARRCSGGETVLGDFRVEYTPGPRLAPRLLPARAERHRVRRRRRRRPHPAGGVRARADAAARHRRRGVGRARSTSSRAGSPQALALTHFGRVDDVGPHLAAVRERCTRRSRSPPATARRPSRPASRERVAARAPDLAAQYEQAAPPDHLYLGVRRYLDKRAAGG